MRGNVTDLGTRVREYFDTHSGEHSVKEIAGFIGVAPNTVGQYLLALAEWGILARRMEGVARGRHYVYALATDPAGLVPQQIVWYDDNQGQVHRCFEWGTRVDVHWDNGGHSVVSRSDLLTNTEYEELNNS